MTNIGEVGASGEKGEVGYSACRYEIATVVEMTSIGKVGTLSVWSRSVIPLAVLRLPRLRLAMTYSGETEGCFAYLCGGFYAFGVRSHSRVKSGCFFNCLVKRVLFF